MEKIEFNHPTSLSHEKPEVPWGIEANTSSSIRLEVSKAYISTRMLCDEKNWPHIRVVFKKNVQESNWTCKLSSTKDWSFNVGVEVSGGPELTVSAKDGPSAKKAICAKLTAGKNNTEKLIF